MEDPDDGTRGLLTRRVEDRGRGAADGGDTGEHRGPERAGGAGAGGVGAAEEQRRERAAVLQRRDQGGGGAAQDGKEAGYAGTAEVPRRGQGGPDRRLQAGGRD